MRPIAFMFLMLLGCLSSGLLSFGPSVRHYCFEFWRKLLVTFTGKHCYAAERYNQDGPYYDV